MALFVFLCHLAVFIRGYSLDFPTTDSLLAMEQLEEAYKASIVPENKEAPNKRYSGKPNRREQPLFDINPRTAKEFLARAQSEDGVDGVQFQQPDQEFTQWKEEEMEASMPESPLPAPSGYAEALMRKLNIKNGPDISDTKGTIIHDYDISSRLTNKVRQNQSSLLVWRSRNLPGNITKYLQYHLRMSPNT